MPSISLWFILVAILVLIVLGAARRQWTWVAVGTLIAISTGTLQLHLTKTSSSTIDGQRRWALPVMRVVVGNIEVPIVTGTHCWTGGCADYLPIVSLLKVKGIEPTVVPKGANLRVSFDYRPISAVIHLSGQPAQLILLSNNEINLNLWKDPGIYVYTVSAHWKEGDVDFGFQVQVEP